MAPQVAGVVDSVVRSGREVWFSFGLRLPKADGFESPGIPSLNMSSGVKFCINERGEVERATLAWADVQLAPDAYGRSVLRDE